MPSTEISIPEIVRTSIDVLFPGRVSVSVTVICEFVTAMDALTPACENVTVPAALLKVPAVASKIMVLDDPTRSKSLTEVSLMTMSCRRMFVPSHPESVFGVIVTCALEVIWKPINKKRRVAACFSIRILIQVY